MRQSALFTKSQKSFPADEEARGSKFLVRAGFIHKAMAGVYEYLPLGFRVLKKIEQIIRDEMNAVGGQELILTSLQEKQVWEKTGRWSDKEMDVWFKTKLKSDAELGLAATHEEPITAMMKNFISSYRDLPVLTYQFQTKFRNELRAKSGILRTREFLMKDLYSFAKDQREHDRIYEDVKEAYFRIFAKVGLGDKTFMTFASGGSFSKYSHEFQVLAEVGEDVIYLDKKKKVAVNKEVLSEEVLKDLGLKKENLEEARATEVGNIFSLGTRFSDAFGLDFVDETGKKHPVVMGSYGIGPGRVMGVIAEVFSDDKGLNWPLEVAPFKIHLLELEGGDGGKTYQDLQEAGLPVLYDDRKISAGEKFAEADLLGIPYRAVVSKKTAGKVEMKKRGEDTVSLVSKDDLLKVLKAKSKSQTSSNK